MKEQTEKYKIINGKVAKGKKEFDNYNENRVITNPRNHIAAFCYQCLCGYADFTTNKDCKAQNCPLYPFMPYNPNRHKKVMSEKQKENAAKNNFKRKSIKDIRE